MINNYNDHDDDVLDEDDEYCSLFVLHTLQPTSKSNKQF